MSASPQSTAAEAWVDLILGTVDPAETWTAIFARLRESVAVQSRSRRTTPRDDCPRPAVGRKCMGSLAGVPPLRPDRHRRTQAVLDQSRPALARRSWFSTAFRCVNCR